jgi:hypothetical protein
MNKMSLFRPTAEARDLLLGIAAITGIPLSSLLHAERRMTSLGSLQPLKELLTSPSVPKADKLRFKIGFSQKRQTSLANSEDVATCFGLKVVTARGTIDVKIDLVLRRRKEISAQVPPSRQAFGSSGEQQMAKILVCYTLEAGLIKKSFKQAVVISESENHRVHDKNQNRASHEANTKPQSGPRLFSPLTCAA